MFADEYVSTSIAVAWSLTTVAGFKRLSEVVGGSGVYPGAVAAL